MVQIHGPMDEPLDEGKNSRKASLMHRAPVNFQLAYVKKPVCIHQISCLPAEPGPPSKGVTDRQINQPMDQPNDQPMDGHTLLQSLGSRRKNGASVCKEKPGFSHR